MSRNTFLLVVFLLLSVLGVAFLKFQFSRKVSLQNQTPKVAENVVVSPIPLPSPEVMGTSSAATPLPDPIAQHLAQLTPQQKVAQLLALPLKLGSNSANSTDSANVSLPPEFLGQMNPGFIIFYGERLSAVDVSQYVNMLTRQHVGILPWFGADHEGGLVQRLSGLGFTKLPTWQIFCKEKSTNKNAQLGISANELAQAGIHFVFGPDIDTGGSNPFLKTRVCASDPAVVEKNAENWVSAFNGAHIISVLKHYPGIGGGQKDLHQEFEVVPVDPADTQIFIDLATKFPQTGIMIAHAGVRGLNENVPCSLSADCVGKLRQLLPNTLLFSDALEMQSVLFVGTVKNGNLPQLAEQAFLAGDDVLVFDSSVTTTQVQSVVDALAKRYTDEPAFAQRVDGSVRRILQQKTQNILSNGGGNL